MKRITIAIVLAAAACGGGSKKPDTTTNTTTTAAAGSVKLELGEIKIIDVNKNQAVLVHADGVIEADGKKMAKLTPDGKISKLDTGEVGFTLGDDGTITGPDGAKVEVTLAADVIKNGDKTISIDAAGALVGGNPEAPKMKIEGATTPGLKRTALYVLIALTTPSAKSPPP